MKGLVLVLVLMGVMMVHGQLSEVLSPPGIAGAKFVCSISTMFWGLQPEVGTVFENIVGIGNLTSDVICNEDLNGYFLYSDFNYQTMDDNENDLTCFKGNDLTTYLNTNASFILHQFDRFDPFERGIAYTDNLYHDRNRYREGNVNVRSVVVECRFPDQVLEALEQSSFGNPSSHVTMRIQIESSPFQDMFTSPVMHVWSRGVMGTLYLIAILLILKYLRRHYRNSKSTERGHFYSSPTVASLILLLIFYTYFTIFLYAEGFWVSGVLPTRIRVASMLLLTGIFSGSALLIALLWRDLLHAFERNKLHAKYAPSFWFRQGFWLVTGGSICVLFDLISAGLIIFRVIDINDAIDYLAGAYLLLHLFVGIFFLYESFHFRQKVLNMADYLEQNSYDSRKARFLKKISKYMAISGLLKVMGVASIVALMFQGYSQSPVYWGIIWTFTFLFRWTDGFFMILICQGQSIKTEGSENSSTGNTSMTPGVGMGTNFKSGPATVTVEEPVDSMAPFNDNRYDHNDAV